MVSETESAVSPSLPSEPLPEPTSITELPVSELPVTTGEPEATEDTAVTDGTEKAPEEVSPAFDAALERNADWKTEYASRVEQAKTEGLKAAQTRLHPLLQKAAEAHSGTLMALDGLREATQQVRQVLAKAADNGAISQETAERLVPWLQGLARVADGVDHHTGWTQGAAYGVLEMIKAAKLPDDVWADQWTGYQRRLGNVLARIEKPEAVFADLVDTIRESAHKEGEEAGYKRGLKDRTAATAITQKADARRKQGPAEVKGTGGGKSYNTKEAVYIARGRGELTSNEATRILNSMIAAERER